MESPENTMQEELNPTLFQDFDEFDHYLIDRANTHPFPQTRYQCNHFVTDSHPTDYRAVRQTLLELATRKHSNKKIQINMKKAYIEIARKQKQIEETTDPFDAQMLEVEIEDLQLDIEQYEKKIQQCNLELRYYLDSIKEKCTTPEDTDKYFADNDDEERKYWIARMAKQSATDMIGYGTVSAGQIDSLLMMPKEDQEKSLNLAMRYAGAINKGIDQIRLRAESEVKYLGDDLPVTHMLEDGTNKV